MKKILLLVLLILVIGFSYYQLEKSTKNSLENSIAVSDNNTNNASVKEETTYYFDKYTNTYIIFFNQLELELNANTNPTVFLENAKNNEYKFAINAGYFTEEFDHAGLLMINGNLEYALAAGDKQLTKLVVIQHDSKIIDFIDASEESYNELEKSNNISAFQTGPAIIENSSINQQEINNSLNGDIKALRSFIGYTQSGKQFIGVTVNRVTLNEVANIILNVPSLKNELIFAVNLDGGSSVALYSEENDQFKIGTYKILPYIIGIK